MLIGPGGSGKSSFMDRLIHRRRMIYTSTGIDQVAIVDVDIRNPSVFYSISAFDSNDWREENLDKSLVGQLYQIAHSVQLQLAKSNLSKMTINFPAESESNISASDIEGAVAACTITPAVNEDISKLISSAVAKHGNYSHFDDLLRRNVSLYFRDVGGQVEFQEMISLLMFGPSIFFFIFRADQEFDNTFKVGYRKSVTETVNFYTSSITIKDALLQCLASVYAMDTPKPSVHTQKSHVFIVATHRDQLGPLAEQKLSELNSYLIALIKENGFQSLVQYADRVKNEVLFAVDNTSDDDIDFVPIRSKICDLITSHKEFTVEYPISYLLFSLELRSDKRSILSLDECREMAGKYKIVGNEVLHLLYFLHFQLGIIHFIDIEGVVRIVMKQPEDMFDKVTDLVVRTFSSNSFNLEEVDNLEKKGILTFSTFESVISSKDGITASDFLKILVHLRIIAEFKKPGEHEKLYFIPCVLDHVPRPTTGDMATDIPPLFIKFKCGHCPKGLFGVLITHLMNLEANINNISFTLRDDKIFKNQVSFYVNSSCQQDEISIRLTSLLIEINFYPDHCEDRDMTVAFVCNEVRIKILDYIFSSLDILHYSKDNVGPVMCIKCASCSQLHQVKEGKKQTTIYCSKDHKTARLFSQAGYWWNHKGKLLLVLIVKGM